MRQTGQKKEVKALHIVHPDERISKAIFTSTLHSRRPFDIDKIKQLGSPSASLIGKSIMNKANSQLSFESETSNYKILKAQKLAESEKKRVELHKKARSKQIEIASEKRAM